MDTQKANKDKNLIIGYCYGLQYQKYLPIFSYSVLKCFNDVDLLILCTDTIKYNIKKKLPINCNRVYIEENYFPLKNYGYNDVETYISKSQFYRLLRFLIPIKLVEGYSSLYIGDLDIYYLAQLNRSNTSLFVREEYIAKTNKLSFNNIIRKDTKGNITCRLGGLHYIRVNEYFHKFGELISNIQNNRKAFIALINKARGNIDKDDYLRNEHLLFAMLIENKKINEIEELLNKYPRELYGMHLGPLRNRQTEINSNYLFGKEINKKDQKLLLSDFLKFLIKNKLYDYMYNFEMFRLYYYMLRLMIK